MSELLEALRARGLPLAVAESDTGGLLLEELTAVAGSSSVVLGGVVAYHDGLKTSLLGVAGDVLREHGAVSACAARAMARGVRRVTGADIGVATTGIAGPGGATPVKPVGLAYVAAVDARGEVVHEYHWSGDRAANRASSAAAALAVLHELLSKIATT